MRVPRSSWQATARAKVEDIHSRIPKEWLLSDTDLERAKKQRNLTGSFIEQYLGDDEKMIVSHGSVDLVEKIKHGEHTALNVTQAYCKTAAIAQQIVSSAFFFSTRLRLS